MRVMTLAALRHITGVKLTDFAGNCKTTYRDRLFPSLFEYPPKSKGLLIFFVANSTFLREMRTNLNQMKAIHT